MNTENWCRKFQLGMDLGPVIDFFNTLKKKKNWIGKEKHNVLSENSRYWDWFTSEIENEDVLSLLNFISNRHLLPVNTQKTRVALWEYGSGDTLPPHIDPNISLSSAVIISLVGRFETYLYDQETQSKIIDSVVYGPGDYIILNNTIFCHGGRPLADFRQALIAFVDPSYDMASFWEG